MGNGFKVTGKDQDGRQYEVTCKCEKCKKQKEEGLLTKF